MSCTLTATPSPRCPFDMLPLCSRAPGLNWQSRPAPWPQMPFELCREAESLLWFPMLPVYGSTAWHFAMVGWCRDAHVSWAPLDGSTKEKAWRLIYLCCYHLTMAILYNCGHVPFFVRRAEMTSGDTGIHYPRPPAATGPASSPTVLLYQQHHSSVCKR